MSDTPQVRLLTSTGWSGPSINESQEEITQISEEELLEQKVEEFDEFLDDIFESCVEMIDEAIEESGLEFEDREELEELFRSKLQKHVQRKSDVAGDIFQKQYTHSGYNTDNPTTRGALSQSVRASKRATRQLPDGSHDYGKKKSDTELRALAKAKLKTIGLDKAKRQKK